MTQVVFFDAGETLLGPDPSWSELTVDVLTERGHDVTLDRVRAAFGDARSVFLKAADEGRTFSLSREESEAFWGGYYRAMLERLALDDDGAADALYATFSDPSSYALFPDALPALHALRDMGVRLGVISNFEAWLRVLLQRLEVADLFEELVISGEVGFEKPDPRIFAHAVAAMGVAPTDAMHVGDSPEFDAQAARDCGLTGVLIDRIGRWPDAEPRVTTLTQLPDLLHA